MATGPLDTVLQHLRGLVGPGPGAEPSDGRLLERFARDRDEAAFAVLVRRHGPPVLGVCRRLLRQEQDAEDAFQATFLVLARRAGALDRRGSVAGWLYTVAYRLALRARAAAARRRLHESQVALMSSAAEKSPESWTELQPLLDEELSRLPEKYRLPLLLCYLQEKTNLQAAQELGWPLGSMSKRLARGRELLRRRLARRGFTLAGAVLAAALARNATATVPAPLVQATVRAAVSFAGGAAGSVSSSAAALANGLLQAMAVTRLRVALGVVLILGLAVGVGTLAHQGSASRRAGAAAPDEERARSPGAGDAAKAESPRQVRTDRYGDPLPPGAIARLGTVRFRHDGEAGALVFSPDGTTLASLCSGEVILWESATGRERRRLPLSLAPVDYQLLDFSPDGHILAVVDPRSGITLWDPADGRRLRTLPLSPSEVPDGCRVARFSPDGKTLAVANGTQAHLFDVDTGKAIRQLDANHSGIDDIAFAPDGRSVALATADPSVQLWDLTTAKLLRRFPPGKENLIMRAVFSPDGKLLAAGSRHGVLLWDPATGEDRGRLDAKMGAVVGLAFTPDGRSVLAVGEDGKVRIWDVAGRTLQQTLDGHGFIGRSMALSRDGKRVALGTAYGAIRMWEVETGKELFTEFDGPDATVNCVTFAPGGKTLATGADNGQTRLWDATTWQQTQQLKGSARTLSYTADGKRLATVPHDKTVRVWETTTGAALLTVPVQGADDVRAADFSRNGRRLVSLAWQRPGGNARSRGTTHLVVSDGDSGKQLRRSALPEVLPECLAVTPDGRLALVGDTGGRIHAWDLEAGQEDMLLQGHEHVVAALALSADGRTLVSGSHDRSVRVWEVLIGKEILTLQGHQQAVVAVALSPDGRLAASVDSERGAAGTIRLWDLRDGKEVGRFTDFRSQPTSLAFSPDGSRLVSGMKNGTALVWDVPSPADRPAPNREAISAGKLQALWADLAGSDALKAHQAVWALAEVPEKAVAFLRERLPPATAVDSEHIRRLVADLDSDRFSVRAASAKELEQLGGQAAPALREVLAGTPSTEVRKQVESLLAGVRLVRSPEVLRRLRAIQVLERIGSPDAREVLDGLTRGAPDARETQDARAALERLRRP
jgi:RNA polymerase sigma factor (sigma-70 family)